MCCPSIILHRESFCHTNILSKFVWLQFSLSQYWSCFGQIYAITPAYRKLYHSLGVWIVAPQLQTAGHLFNAGHYF